MLLAMLAVFVGCEKPQKTPVATQPVEQAPEVVATAPSTLPTTRPASVMTIDQQKYEFPPALLRLKKVDDQYRAFLTSDDPREAFEADYQGNSFYFELPHHVNDPAELLAEPIVLRADSSDRRDTADGIFLQGNSYQLQPQEAKIEITGSGLTLDVWISGTFTMFPTRDASAPRRLVPVTAHLSAQVK